MTEDEVVREVRAAGEAFAATHGYNIHAMVAALHELGIASGRELVRLPPRPVTIRPNQSLQPTGAAIAVSQGSTPSEAAPAGERSRSAAEEAKGAESDHHPDSWHGQQN